MILVDIRIERSPLIVRGQWQLTVIAQIERADCNSRGAPGEYESVTRFNDVGGFVTAVSETMTFFAVRMGKLRPKDSHLTRRVVENPADKLIRIPGLH